MRLVKQVTGDEFYKTYLNVINGVLHLTDKELAILAELMTMKNIDDTTKSYLSEKEKSSLLFGSETRKIIQNRLGISPHNLNNYIKSLKDKNMLQEDNKVMKINPNVFIKSAPRVDVGFSLILINEH